METALAGIVVASLLNGLRHGIDVDHVAAIGDIVSAIPDRRRSFWLSAAYALGHAAVVVTLGAAAILLGARIPQSVDQIMTRVVGATLLILGAYVLFSAIRYPHAVRLRSRWQLASELMHRLRRERVPVVIEHDHPHGHDDLHSHGHREEGPGAGGAVALATKTHTHVHRHVSVMPRDPLPSYGAMGAAGIGVLHGVGAETPTQVLLFATAAGAGSAVLGLWVLGAFVTGMLASNAVVAAAFALGARTGKRAPLFYAACATVTAAFSVAVGISYLAG